MKFITLLVFIVLSIAMVIAVLTGYNQKDAKKKQNIYTDITVVSSGNKDNEKMTKIKTQRQVFTVDEQGVPLPTDSVKWWTQGNWNHQYRFSCANAECTIWNGAVATTLPVIVRADASRVKADDKHCSQLYATEQLLENNTADITIVLKFTGIACR